MPTVSEVLENLDLLANPDNVAGMARFAINSEKTLGISIYDLRRIAKTIGHDQPLALELWQCGIHEARILASYIADPEQMTMDTLEKWAADFDSWDVCDQVCELFAKTPFAYSLVFKWSNRPEEFVKRASFAIIAELAWYDKSAPDEKLELFFPIIIREAADERNFVRKAVNWALRNIGKRNTNLNRLAIDCALQIASLGTRSARWIAADALRELRSEKIQAKISKIS
jgi:3-methyladenine DNA glycosylase AlkD